MKKTILILFTVVFAMTSCNKNDNPIDNTTVPTLTTLDITAITPTSATSGGDITDTGGADITAKGVCWSTSPNPTILDFATDEGNNQSNYTSNITGLTRNTTYYVRAYATNSKGTAYGNEEQFNTSGVIDIDGNTYPTVIIGTQEWMAEDLRVTRYPNGDAIPHITDDTNWSNLQNNSTDDAYSFYNNNNTTVYGALYTYAAAIGDNWTRDNTTGQGVCPDGWHLPTDSDWTTLIDYLGGTNVAGGKMKETGTTNWNSPNTGATNSSGFAALPSGFRDTGTGAFTNISHFGYWWIGIEGASSFAYAHYLSFNSSSAYSDPFNTSNGFCVRCVRD